MSPPLVTVIIPSFNNGAFIAMTIESILRQDVDELEIYIVDNASSDKTEAVVASYRNDPRIVFERNPTNIGVVANHHRALNLGTASYLAILHSDDVYEPGHLRRMIDALDANPGCGLAYTAFREINTAGGIHGTPQHPGRIGHDYIGARNELADLLAFDNYILPSTTVFRRRLYNDVGGLDLQLHGAIDWDLWCRFAASGSDFVYFSSPGVLYRIHENQDSNRFYNSPGPLLDHLRILEKFVFGDLRARLCGRETDILRLLEQRMAIFSQFADDSVCARFAAIRGALQTSPRLAGTAIAATATVDEASANATLVSVILTTFDRPELLIRALRSVLQQTYCNIEVIVVNDCGQQVEDLVTGVANGANVQYIRHGVNRGPSAARNTALRCARGEIIAYLDDDDIYLADHVATLVDALRDPTVDFVYSESDYVVERPLHGTMQEVERRKQFDDCSYSKERLFIANYIPVNTWGHRRSIVERIGGFDETLRDHEDWDFLLRAAAQKHLRHIPKVTVEVRHRTQADNALARRNDQFHATFSKLYARHGDLGSPQVAQGRAHMLAYLSRSGPPPAETRSLLAVVDSSGVTMARPIQSATPWLLEARAMPGESVWAAEAMQRWREAGILPRMTLAMMRPPTLSAAPTVASLDAQWHQAEMIELPAMGEDLLTPVNQALLGASADWVGLIDAGDTLAADATFRIANAVLGHPEWQLAYTDEDSLSADGQHLNPHCKPDFSLDYLRGLPYIGGLLLIRRDLFEALGGFDPQYEGAEDYDLLLRAWEHLQATGAGETAIGHIPEVLYHRLQGSGHTRKSVPEVLATAQAALQVHFKRLGIAAEVHPGPFPPSFRVRWPLPEQRPLVSIIIPTRDQLSMLQRCVESLIEKTRYPAYEVLIVDNDSRADDAVRYLEAIESREAELGGRLRVIRAPGEFNFSAMNNTAARAARGEYLLLLNNDTAALHEDWLDEMMGHAVRPDVGAVGAKLLFPDGKIQHAGVILGIRGPAEHPFIGRPPEDRGYFGRAQLVQDLSAVTGACLLVRKSVYEQLGGLDEQAFKVSYNDIDLCLKIRAAGLRVVFTPFALLMHEGSASQKGQVEARPDEAKHKRFAGERLAMYDKWLPVIARDPAYNRHLSLASTEFLLDDQVCVAWDPEWRPRPRLLAHAADREGCGEYRIIAPMRSLVRAGRVQGWETMRLFDPAEMERISPDSLVVQRQMEWPQIEALERHVRYSKAFRVFEIDDLITNLPLKSVHRPHIHKDITKRFRKAAGLCNRLVVATEPLAKAYAGFSDEVVVCPNYLERARWGELRPARAERSRPRVGWAGGIGHAGDLELIVDVVRETAAEVDWVFFGMCPPELKDVVREFHTGIPLDQYAPKLASLDLDLAVAPLEQNAFNEAKSHLRLLEYGVLGYPVICSDLTPYQGDFPVTRVANRFRDWVRAILDAVAEPQALRAQGDALRDKVLAHWMLEDHLDDWLRAWTA